MSNKKLETRALRLTINNQEIVNSYSELRKVKKQLIKELDNLEEGTADYIKKSKDLAKVSDRMETVRKKNKDVANAWKRQTQEFKAGANSVANDITFMGLSVGSLRAQFAQLRLSMLAAAKSGKILKISMLAIPIFAIVAVLASFIKFLTSTQKGMDAVTTVTRPLSVIFQRLLGVVQDFGGYLFDKLTPALNGLKQLLKSIGLLDGEGWLSESIAQGKELDRLIKQIDQSELELIKTRGKLNREFQEQKRIAADVNKTEKERLAAADAAERAYQELTKQENALRDLKIAKMKLEQSFNDTSREDLKELARLEAERENQLAQQEKRLQSIDALRNSANNAQKKKISDEIKLSKREAEQRVKDSLSVLDREHQTHLMALKKRLIDEDLTQRQYDRLKEESELAQLEKILTAREQYKLDTLDIEQQIVDKQLEIKKATEERLEKDIELSKIKDEDERKEYLEKLEREAQEEFLLLTQQRLAGELSEDEFNARKEERELEHLRRMINARKLFGMDTLELEQELSEKELAILNAKFENEKTVTDQIKALKMATAEAFGEEAKAVLANAKSFEEAGRGILNSIRKQIKGYIAEAIVIVLGKTLKELPFPANVVAAPIAAGAAAGLFENLVPSFATGGFTGFGDLGLGKNTGGNIRGVVEDNEYVVNAPSLGRILADPYGASVMSYLENVRNGAPATAAQPVQVNPTMDNSDIVTASREFRLAVDVLLSKPVDAVVRRETQRDIVKYGQEDIDVRNESKSRGSTTS